MVAVQEKTKPLIIEYNEENKHLFSKEAIRFFELAKQGKLHSSKFWRRKSEDIIKLTRQAYEEKPEQGMCPVLVAILNTLPEHTPTDKLEQYIGTIIQEWQQLQAAGVAV